MMLISSPSLLCHCRSQRRVATNLSLPYIAIGWMAWFAGGCPGSRIDVARLINDPVLNGGSSRVISVAA